MGKQYTPAEVAELAFGGKRRLGILLGISEKAPFCWHRSSLRRPAGDLPSLRTVRILLDAATAQKINLPPLFLIYGATAEELATAGLKPQEPITAPAQVAAE